MTVVDVIGGWAIGEGPSYRRLAKGLRGAIERRDLLPGETLPAERTLSRTLAVSQTMVVTSYDLLRQDGLMESRQGSRTRVAEGTAAMAPGVATDAAGDLLGGGMAVKESVTLFTRAALDGAQVVADAITGLDPGEVARQVAESGYEALGLPELRRAVAEHLAA